MLTQGMTQPMTTDANLGYLICECIVFTESCTINNGRNKNILHKYFATLNPKHTVF